MCKIMLKPDVNYSGQINLIFANKCQMSSTLPLDALKIKYKLKEQQNKPLVYLLNTKKKTRWGGVSPLTIHPPSA